MSAKTLFCRIKNFLFYEKPQPQIPAVRIWHVDTTNGPSDLPTGMHTWQADPVADKGLFEELNPTQQIPRITDDLPAPRYAAAVTFLGGAMNDVALRCEAAKALRFGDVNTVLAGLYEYAERHPVAA